jgi:hypothetical protein
MKMKVISFKHPFLLFATLLELSKNKSSDFSIFYNNKKICQPKKPEKTHFWLSFSKEINIFGS